MGHNGKSVPLDALALSPHFLSHNFSDRLCWMNVLFFHWDTHTHTFKYLIAPTIARDCCIIVAVTTRNNCTKQSIIYLYLLQSSRGGEFNLFIKLNTIFSFPIVSKNSATYSNKYIQAVVHTEGLGGWSLSRFGISMLSALDMAQGIYFLWF